MKNFMNTYTMISVLIIALFPSLFLWGIFERGIGAVGYNMTFFGVLLFLLYFIGMKNWWKFFVKNIAWILPVGLIFVSFSLFGNTFIKAISICILPVIFLFFSSLGKTQNITDTIWSLPIIKSIFFRSTTFKQGIAFLKDYINSGGKTGIVVKKVGIGLGILGLLNIWIVGLLSSADSEFDTFISSVGEGLSFSIVWKLIIAGLLFVYFTRLKLSWKDHQVIASDNKQQPRDSIIGGIVIGGTLFTYILFLVIQLQTLLSGALPEGVENAAHFAKTGFWQLFIISIINIVFFFVYFRKTHSTVQAMLFGFIIASVAILLSAANKMYLYVTDYGFSYEKFYALYAVIFFGVLFLTMITLLVSKKYNDILKISIFLALGMYALITVFPTDSFIFKHNTNIAVSHTKFTGKYQSHMLSSDIKKDVLELQKTQPDVFRDHSWKEWLDKKEAKAKKQKWYEKNLNSF